MMYLASMQSATVVPMEKTCATCESVDTLVKKHNVD